MSKKIFWLFWCFVILNIYFDAKFQLHFDELYYWVWSRNLSLSYFDHPPIIAYFIRFTTLIYDGSFWVRLPALICSSATIYIIYKLANRMFDKDVALFALAISLATPVFFGTAFIISPDSPLFMFWSLAFYSFYIAVFEDKLRLIYVSGIFVGLACLSKYTAVFILPSFFLFLLFSPRYRYLIRRFEIYGALLIAIVMFTPVVIWNYEHNWASFVFQFHHGMSHKNKISVITFLNYASGQLAICGPILFIALLVYLIKNFRQIMSNDKLAYLIWPFLIGFIFFSYRSFCQDVDINWSDFMYISCVVFLAYWIKQTNQKWIVYSSLILMWIVFVILKFPLQFAPAKLLYNKAPFIMTFYGERQTMNQVHSLLKPDEIVIGCDYANAARAWYYLNQKTYVLPNNEFAYMFKFLLDKRFYDSNQALYVCDHLYDKDAMENLKHKFKYVDKPDTLYFSNKLGVKKTYVYHAYN